MISDEERREIAEGLRITVASFPHAYAADLWDEMGVDVEDGIMAKADVLRVAELIDRPVCHPVSVPFGPFGDTAAGCSVCGEPLMLNAYTRPPSYYPRCAKCGAEVDRELDEAFGLQLLHETQLLYEVRKGGEE